MLRVGLIGPRKTRNGTGPFVARFLVSAGAEIVALASSSLKSATEATGLLSAALGTNARVHESVKVMFQESALDAVAICSPAPMHGQHLWQALEARVHVFCEKPLLWDAVGPLEATTIELTSRFAAHRRLLYLNTQWVFTLDDFAALHSPPVGARTFTMELFGSHAGPDLFWESVPHPISLLVALGAKGSVRDVAVSWSSALDSLVLKFLAERDGAGLPIDVELNFGVRPEQPRPARYSIDGRWMVRGITAEYGIWFSDGSKRICVEDPLGRSVRRFVELLASRMDVEQHHASVVAQMRMLQAVRDSMQLPTG